MVDADATSCGDVVMMLGSRWWAVSGIPPTALGPWWFQRRELQSCREGDVWQGYGSNTAHPSDANLRRKSACDIAASHQIYDMGSNGRWEFEAAGFGMMGAREIFKCFNNVPGHETFGYGFMWVPQLFV